MGKQSQFTTGLKLEALRLRKSSGCLIGLSCLSIQAPR